MWSSTDLQRRKLHPNPPPQLCMLNGRTSAATTLGTSGLRFLQPLCGFIPTGSLCASLSVASTSFSWFLSLGCWSRLFACAQGLPLWSVWKCTSCGGNPRPIANTRRVVVLLSSLVLHSGQFWDGTCTISNTSLWTWMKVPFEMFSWVFLLGFPSLFSFSKP